MGTLKTQAKRPKKTSNRTTTGRTREAWLSDLVDLLRPEFAEFGYTIPAKVHVSVGFPSGRALSLKKRAIGECWSVNCSSDGNPQIFLSPLIDEVTVAHVLVHELAHAVTPGHHHKGPFVKLIRALGLLGKPTATHASEQLAEKLLKFRRKLGAYPHSLLNANAMEKERKKQGTRLLKLSCACVEPRIIRASAKVVEGGPILCMLCAAPFEGEDAGEEEGE